MKYSFIFGITAGVDDEAAAARFERLASEDGEVRQHMELIDDNRMQYNRRPVRSFRLQEVTDDLDPVQAIQRLFMRIERLEQDSNFAEACGQYDAFLSCYFASDRPWTMFLTPAQLSKLGDLSCSLYLDVE